MAFLWRLGFFLGVRFQGRSMGSQALHLGLSVLGWIED